MERYRYLRHLFTPYVNSYDMTGNVFTNNMELSDDCIHMIVTDLARLLNYNRLIFPEKYFEGIRREKDRGVLACIIYRNGSNDTIHVVQPNANGTINLDVIVI